MRKQVTFEYPCGQDGQTTPEVQVAVAEIMQYASKRLMAVGVDPVRFICTAKLDSE